LLTEVIFAAIDSWTPQRISSFEDPRCISATISDSANTAQVVVNTSFLEEFKESGPISERGICIISATVSRKTPAPDAHLSFMMKFVRFPSESHIRIRLPSAPTSMTVLA